MLALPWELVLSYRSATFRAKPGLRLQTKDEARDFVNERGFVYFWPISGIELPSLWAAVAGDRPVADAHDDPGHVTWGWKDSALSERIWYYGKILRRKATIISLQMAPNFYALSENYGEPEEDYLTLYQQGQMTQEAKSVYEALLFEGALDTIALRKAARLTSQESTTRFEKALADLQADFKILPIGVAPVGAWRYAFIYEITARHYPELPEKARFIGELDARERIAAAYFASLGAAQPSDLAKLFGWRSAEVEQTLDRLVQAETIRRPVHFDGKSGEWSVFHQLAPVEQDSEVLE